VIAAQSDASRIAEIDELQPDRSQIHARRRCRGAPRGRRLNRAPPSPERQPHVVGPPRRPWTIRSICR
jgi:hypothetical protein